MSKKLLPIGYVGITNVNNIHNNSIWGVPAGEKFEIVSYGGLPYKVKFFDTKWNDLNDEGPYLTNECIILPKAAQVLYGR